MNLKPSKNASEGPPSERSFLNPVSNTQNFSNQKKPPGWGEEKRVGGGGGKTYRNSIPTRSCQRRARCPEKKELKKTAFMEHTRQESISPKFRKGLPIQKGKTGRHRGNMEGTLVKWFRGDKQGSYSYARKRKKFLELTHKGTFSRQGDVIGSGGRKHHGEEANRGNATPNHNTGQGNIPKQ